jgi:hypothetical protein
VDFKIAFARHRLVLSCVSYFATTYTLNNRNTHGAEALWVLPFFYLPGEASLFTQ